MSSQSSQKTDHQQLESMLARQAGQLAALRVSQPPVRALRTAYRRRRRRRRIMEMTAGSALLMAATLLVVANSPHARRLLVGLGTAAIEQQVGNVNQRMPQQQAMQPLPQAGSALSVPAPELASGSFEDLNSERPAAGQIYGYMLVSGEGEEAQVLEAGYYLPAQVQQVSLEDLEPAQRDAVRRVLGLEPLDLAKGPI